jgi:hypothetical protein
VHYEHSSGVGSFLSDEELAETRAWSSICEKWRTKLLHLEAQ